MQHYVDHFEEIPAVVLACLARYRNPHPTEGASVYPACQNLLLAARALGYGGVLTMWHAMAEDDLRELLAIPEAVLSGKKFVTGETFSMGDIPLGCEVQRWMRVPMERPAFPNVQAWFDRLCARPALVHSLSTSLRPNAAPPCR